MVILTDTREQLAYSFSDHRYCGTNTEKATLPLGDYSIPGWEDKVAIERKSIDDLLQCLCKERDRFERELSKLSHYDFSAVVIEASFADLAQGKYRSQMKAAAAVGSIMAFMIRYRRIHFAFAGSRRGGEFITWSLLRLYKEEVEKRYKAMNRSQTQKGN